MYIMAQMFFFLGVFIKPIVTDWDGNDEPGEEAIAASGANSDAFNQWVIEVRCWIVVVYDNVRSFSIPSFVFCFGYVLRHPTLRFMAPVVDDCILFVRISTQKKATKAKAPGH